MEKYIDNTLLQAFKALQRHSEILTQSAITFESPFFSVLDILERKGSKLERMLLQLKWPPPGLLPATLLDRLSLGFEEGLLTVEDVENVFVRFYNHDRLQEMLHIWSEHGHFPHRMRILKEVVAVHTEGRFELSIPALLPQIEGVIAEIFGHSGHMQGKNFKDYLELAFAEDSRFNRIGKVFFLGTLLENFGWRNPIPFFSRHAVLHGADTNYASASNSLRLILVFDQLQDSIRYVASHKGQCFHVAICPTLQKSTGRRVYRDRSSASEVGLRPCTRCLSHLPPEI